MNIEGKVIVITGGASGLGQATARYMVLEKGARVALFDLNRVAGDATVAEVGVDVALFWVCVVSCAVCLVCALGGAAGIKVGGW